MNSEKDKVIVAGSRGIDEKGIVESAVDESPFSPYHGELISGGASGVDTLAKEFAEIYSHIEYVEFEADWDTYGSVAGPIRNQEMAEYGNCLIAIWDGESPGTENMIEEALERGLDTYVKVVE